MKNPGHRGRAFDPHHRPTGVPVGGHRSLPSKFLSAPKDPAVDLRPLTSDGPSWVLGSEKEQSLRSVCIMRHRLHSPPPRAASSGSTRRKGRALGMQTWGGGVPEQIQTGLKKKMRICGSPICPLPLLSKVETLNQETLHQGPHKGPYTRGPIRDPTPGALHKGPYTRGPTTGTRPTLGTLQ
ncbi:unnamed protein product [Gadus morhua 'NCC']